MKVLFIGGTGNISAAVSRLAVSRGVELYHLNRGQHAVKVEGVQTIHADIRDASAVREALGEHRWDVVVDWIAFVPPDVQRDIDLFEGRTQQYIFISSASVYQKPLSHPIVTEATPLANPFWDYSRNKIACEELLTSRYRESGFPITIVRPSLTYQTGLVPVAIGGWSGYTIIDRIRNGRELVVPGDGTSLWTVTHSDDFAKGFVGLMGNQQAIGNAFHITSDEILTWDQIYQAVGLAAGREAKLIHMTSEFIADEYERRGRPGTRGSLLGDKSCSCIFDNTRIKRFVPGYCADISFAEGMRRTVRWFDADDQRKTVSAETTDILDGLISAWRGRGR